MNTQEVAQTLGLGLDDFLQIEDSIASVLNLTRNEQGEYDYREEHLAALKEVFLEGPRMRPQPDEQPPQSKERPADNEGTPAMEKIPIRPKKKREKPGLHRELGEDPVNTNRDWLSRQTYEEVAPLVEQMASRLSGGQESEGVMSRAELEQLVNSAHPAKSNLSRSNLADFGLEASNRTAAESGIQDMPLSDEVKAQILAQMGEFPGRQSTMGNQQPISQLDPKVAMEVPHIPVQEFYGDRPVHNALNAFERFERDSNGVPISSRHEAMANPIGVETSRNVSSYQDLLTNIESQKQHFESRLQQLETSGGQYLQQENLQLRKENLALRKELSMMQKIIENQNADKKYLIAKLKEKFSIKSLLNFKSGGAKSLLGDEGLF